MVFLKVRRHSKWRELVSSYMDGQVSQAEAREVEDHLTACEECRAELDSLRATVRLMKALPQLQTPRSFALAEAPAPLSSKAGAKGLSSLPVVWAVRLATPVAAALLIALLLGDAAGILSQSKALKEADITTPPLSQSGAREDFSRAPQVAPAPAPAAQPGHAGLPGQPGEAVTAEVAPTQAAPVPPQMAAQALPTPLATPPPTTAMGAMPAAAAAPPASASAPAPTLAPSAGAYAPATTDVAEPTPTAAPGPGDITKAAPEPRELQPARVLTDEGTATPSAVEPATPEAPPKAGATPALEVARSLAPATPIVREPPAASQPAAQDVSTPGPFVAQGGEKALADADAEGISLPLRQLQLAVGGLLGLLILATLWTLRRGRAR
jgi:hypothetical protein